MDIQVGRIGTKETAAIAKGLSRVMFEQLASMGIGTDVEGAVRAIMALSHMIAAIAKQRGIENVRSYIDVVLTFEGIGREDDDALTIAPGIGRDTEG